MLIPWMLAAAIEGHALADATCELYCLDRAATAEVQCGDDKGCLEEISDTFDVCLEPCPIEVSVPDREELVALGLAFAEERFGKVVLIEDHDYAHPDGGLNSVMIVVSTDPSLSAEEVREALADGTDPAKFDGVLRGIELGARLEQPPIVAFWEGIPYEFLADALLTQTDPESAERKPELIGRHGTPVFPVFEYALSDGSRLFFDPRRGATAGGDEMVFHVNEAMRETDQWLIALESTKRGWAAYLSADAEVE